MPAYIAFIIDIHDHAAFTGYARAAAPTYPAHGGGVALRGPIVDVLEGTVEVKHDTRLVVLQFPSLERARAWWESAEYRQVARLRQPPVADSRVFLVDGIDRGVGSAGLPQAPSALHGNHPPAGDDHGNAGRAA